MANLELVKQWNDGIYQIEVTDPVEGGPDGVSNRQARELGGNALFLKGQMDEAVGGDTAAGFGLKTLGGHAAMADGMGRDLRVVFGIESTDPAVYIPLIMAEIRRRCNNDGEMDAGGVPDFSGVMIGDYIDGISLNGIAAPAGNGAIATQPWNNTYKNNRIVVAGFNTYKGMGSWIEDGGDGIDATNVKNHVLFVFRNVIATARMNATHTNGGGYRWSELRTWLEGRHGLGNGVVAEKLKEQLGGEYLYTISKVHSEGGDGGDWAGYTLWLPSEFEIFGGAFFGAEGPNDNEGSRLAWTTPIQIPLFQGSYEYRIRRLNGTRRWYWTQTPSAASSSAFALVAGIGNVNFTNAGSVGGCAPAFCVA